MLCLVCNSALLHSESCLRAQHVLDRRWISCCKKKQKQKKSILNKCLPLVVFLQGPGEGPLAGGDPPARLRSSTAEQSQPCALSPTAEPALLKRGCVDTSLRVNTSGPKESDFCDARWGKLLLERAAARLRLACASRCIRHPPNPTNVSSLGAIKCSRSDQ